MSKSVVILDTEMITPVGFSAAETAASTAARIARIHESGIMDPNGHPITLASVPEEGLPDLLDDHRINSLPSDVSRILRLIGGPLEELCQKVEQVVSSCPDILSAETPLFLGLPDASTSQTSIASQLISAIPIQLHPEPVVSPTISARLSQESVQLFLSGRAAGLEAITAAASAIAAGSIEMAIAGGADCYLDVERLFRLANDGRIRNDQQPDGFPPGEGAAFVWLASKELSDRIEAEPLATITASGTGEEAGHLGSDDPYLGEGLSDVITAILQQASDCNPIQSVYSTFNGERYWARELGVSVIRNQERFDDSYAMEHPAECFGDLGAAHGAALTGLAALSIANDTASAPTLVYASSDFGRRAAILLEPC